MIILQDYEQLAKYNTGIKEDRIIRTQFALTYFLKTNNDKNP